MSTATQVVPPPDPRPSIAGARVAAIAHNAGFSGNDLVIAVAIAKAESGWNYSAKGGPNSDGTYDWGLFQINDVHKPSAAIKQNPVENAKFAFKLYSGRGKKFTDWAAYNSGAYKAHMTEATKSVARLRSEGAKFERDTVAAANKTFTGETLGDKIGGAVENLNPANKIASYMEWGGNLFGNYLAFVAGGVLLVLGVFLISRNTLGKAATKAAKGALTVTPAGRTAKAAAGATGAARVAKTVEQRAAESIALADAKKAIQAKREADRKASTPDFATRFREQQAAYRRSVGVDVVTGKRT